MPISIPQAGINQLFYEARTYNEWTKTPVSEPLLRELYDIVKWGPTSANSCPARFVWVRSAEGKNTLAGLAIDSNKAKILAAPVTVIIAYDLAFSETLPKRNPARGAIMKPLFQQPGIAELTAMRNGSLQGAYFILAARALGLDCGPMSHFYNAGVDEVFFAGTQLKSNFICCIGYGKAGTPYPRKPRLTFEEAC